MEISEVNGVEVDCTGNKPRRMGKRNSQDLYSGEEYEYISSLSKDDYVDENNAFGGDSYGHGQMDMGMDVAMSNNENCNSMNVNTRESTFESESVHEFEPRRKKSLISTGSGVNTFLSQQQPVVLQERGAVSGSGVRSNSVPFGLGGGLDESAGMMEC